MQDYGETDYDTKCRGGDALMMKYIIVQAGGKGSRLKHLTTNKPKALVPIENKPMLFHLFHKYPDKSE